jgi:hypothetical protein
MEQMKTKLSVYAALFILLGLGRTALAQEIPLPLPDIEHAIAFLKFGGTYAEAHDLAAKLTQEAQGQIDKLNAAAKDKASAQAPVSAEQQK